ncbi:unnamed protein product [Arctogadus glacialis]
MCAGRTACFSGPSIDGRGSGGCGGWVCMQRAGALSRPTRGLRHGSGWGRIVACDLKVAGVGPGMNGVLKDSLWTSSPYQRKCGWLIEARPRGKETEAPLGLGTAPVRGPQQALCRLRAGPARSRPCILMDGPTTCTLRAFVLASLHPGQPGGTTAVVGRIRRAGAMAVVKDGLLFWSN